MSTTNSTLINRQVCEKNRDALVVGMSFWRRLSVVPMFDLTRRAVNFCLGLMASSVRGMDSGSVTAFYSSNVYSSKVYSGQDLSVQVHAGQGVTVFINNILIGLTFSKNFKAANNIM